jgi:hypothetical protein
MEEKKMNNKIFGDDINKRVLRTLEAYLLANRELLSPNEVGDIETQISYIRCEIHKETMKRYVSQLKAFKKHLSSALDMCLGDDCTNESVDDFYNSNFEITFRGKTITLANGAEVFQAIEEIIDTEISDCEEV